MSESKATPRPWVVNRGEYAYIKNPLYKGIVADLGCAPLGDPLYVCNPDDHKCSPEQWLANAELICRAVNCHAELVAALREALAALDLVTDVAGDTRFPSEQPDDWKRITAAYDDGKAALAKAGEPTA